MHVLTEQAGVIDITQHIEAGLIDEGAVAFDIQSVDGFGGGVEQQVNLGLALV